MGITREEAEEDLNALIGEDPDNYQFPDDEYDDEGDDDDDDNDEEEEDEGAWEEASRGQEEEREALVGPPVGYIHCNLNLHPKETFNLGHQRVMPECRLCCWLASGTTSLPW